VQFSFTSQTPAEARHTTVDAKKASAGQAAAEPVHVSAGSQTPDETLHIVPLAVSISAGQEATTPVHDSETSHTPAEARHTVPAAMNPSVGHAAAEPLQLSATSHTPVAALQTVPAADRASVGQLPLTPLQSSSHGSQTPAERTADKLFRLHIKHICRDKHSGQNLYTYSRLISQSRLDRFAGSTNNTDANKAASAGQAADKPVHRRFST
jgi:hypothetical protein